MTAEQTQAVPYVQGEVLALLSPLQELRPGLYVIQSVADGWTMLTELFDDEATERLIVTDHTLSLPSPLLELFMPVGIRLGAVA